LNRSISRELRQANATQAGHFDGDIQFAAEGEPTR
jgi:hypothetical protein